MGQSNPCELLAASHAFISAFRLMQACLQDVSTDPLLASWEGRLFPNRQGWEPKKLRAMHVRCVHQQLLPDTSKGLRPAEPIILLHVACSQDSHRNDVLECSKLCAGAHRLHN